jgi:hypothetical protein
MANIIEYLKNLFIVISVLEGYVKAAGDGTDRCIIGVGGSTVEGLTWVKTLAFAPQPNIVGGEIESQALEFELAADVLGQ